MRRVQTISRRRLEPSACSSTSVARLFSSSSSTLDEPTNEPADLLPKVHTGSETVSDPVIPKRLGSRVPKVSHLGNIQIRMSS